MSLSTSPKKIWDTEGVLRAVESAYERYIESPSKLFHATLQRGHFQAAADMLPDMAANAGEFRVTLAGIKDDLKAEQEVLAEAPDVNDQSGTDHQAGGAPPAPAEPGPAPG